MIEFQECFWGTKSDPLKGISVVHETFTQSIEELESMLSFFQDYVHTHDQMGSKLCDMARLKSPSSSSILLSPMTLETEDSMLKHIIGNFKQELGTVGAIHKLISQNLQITIKNIRSFLDENKKFSSSKKDPIDSQYKKLVTLEQTVRQTRLEYRLKYNQNHSQKRNSVDPLSTKITKHDNNRHSQESDQKEEEIQQQKETNSLFKIGDTSFSVSKINDILLDMKYNTPNNDIKQFFSTYRECYYGSDLLSFLEKHYQMGASAAIQFINELLKRDVLKSISRNNSFSTSSAYQFKLEFLDGEEDKKSSSQRELKRREMDYKQAVAQYETVRESIEVDCLEYLNKAQTLEEQRLRLIKEALFCLHGEQGRLVPVLQTCNEKLLVPLETLDADREIQVMVERKRTGSYRLPPCIFESGSGEVGYQQFGTSLEKLSPNDVPPILHDFFERLRTHKDQERVLSMWMKQTNIDSPAQVYQLKKIINSKSDWQSQLSNTPTSQIISLLKLFLLELPISVCHEELYEPLKLLYLSKSEDFDIAMRLNSIRNLLSSLPTNYYKTLDFFILYFNNLTKQCDATDDATIGRLATNLGFYFLRPEEDNLRTAHEKHPSRLLKDLISYHPELFNVVEEQPIQFNDTMSEADTSVHRMLKEETLSSTTKVAYDTNTCGPVATSSMISDTVVSKEESVFMVEDDEEQEEQQQASINNNLLSLNLNKTHSQQNQLIDQNLTLHDASTHLNNDMDTLPLKRDDTIHPTRQSNQEMLPSWFTQPQENNLSRTNSGADEPGSLTVGSAIIASTIGTTTTSRSSISAGVTREDDVDALTFNQWASDEIETHPAT